MTSSVGVVGEVSLSSSDDEEITSWRRPEGPERKGLDIDEVLTAPSKSQAEEVDYDCSRPAYVTSVCHSISDDEDIGSWRRPEGPASGCLDIDRAVAAPTGFQVPETDSESFRPTPLKSRKHRVFMRASAQEWVARLERHRSFLKRILTQTEIVHIHGRQAQQYYQSMERKIVAEARGMLSSLTLNYGSKRRVLQGTCDCLGDNMFAISIGNKDLRSLSAHSWVLLCFESSLSCTCRASARQGPALSGQCACFMPRMHPMVVYCNARDGPMCYFHAPNQENVEFQVEGYLYQTHGYLGDLLRQWEVCRLMPDPPLLSSLLCEEEKDTPANVRKSDLAQSSLLRNLNESQLHAVCCCLHSDHRLHCIQGPPGTGKSKTILSLITHLVRESASSTDLILVTASSNKACQVLAEGFRHDKIMRRIPIALAGNEGKLPEDAAKLRNIFVHGMGSHFAKQIHLAEDVASSRGIQVLARASSWIKAWTPQVFEDARIGSQIECLNRSDSSTREHNLKRLLTNLESLDDKLEAELLSRAKVLFVTLSSLAKPQFRLSTVAGRTVPWAIIDEAGQAVEAQILPLLEWSPEKLLLVGDTKQLSASAVSAEGCSAGYDSSLMSRVEGKLPRLMLSTQYRMLPPISRFPNAHFYDGELKDAESVCAAETVAPDVWLASGCPGHTLPAYTYMNTQGKECKESNSWANDYEASLCVALACQILGGHAEMLKAKQIGTKDDLDEQLRNYHNSNAAPGKGVHGMEHARSSKCIIITFYRAQVNKLEDQVALLPPQYKPQVHTVDSFQGSEAETVIVSFVRTAFVGGFLQDFRRLNVALTRAKRSLFVAGHMPSTIASNFTHLRALAEDAVKHHVVICGKEVYDKLQTECGIAAPSFQEASLQQRLDQELQESIHDQWWPAKRSRCVESQVAPQRFLASRSTIEVPHDSFKLESEHVQSIENGGQNLAKRVCLTKGPNAIRQVEPQPAIQGLGVSSLNQRLHAALDCSLNVGEKQKGKWQKQRLGWETQQHELSDQGASSQVNIVDKLNASLDELL